MKRGRFTLRETAAALGLSHANVIVIERKAIGKLVIGLGLMTYEELPERIRKHLRRPRVTAVVATAHAELLGALLRLESPTPSIEEPTG